MQCRKLEAFPLTHQRTNVTTLHRKLFVYKNWRTDSQETHIWYGISCATIWQEPNHTSPEIMTQYVTSKAAINAFMQSQFLRLHYLSKSNSLNQAKGVIVDRGTRHLTLPNLPVAMSSSFKPLYFHTCLRVWNYRRQYCRREVIGVWLGDRRAEVKSYQS